MDRVNKAITHIKRDSGDNEYLAKSAREEGYSKNEINAYKKRALFSKKRAQYMEKVFKDVSDINLKELSKKDIKKKISQKEQEVMRMLSRYSDDPQWQEWVNRGDIYADPY